MIKKIFILGSASFLALGLAACSNTSASGSGASAKTEETNPVQAESAEKAGSEEAVDEQTAEGAEADEKTDEDPAVDEQKEMAIEALKGILKDAEKGIIYRFSTGFAVGESTRGEVYAAISEPEEKVGEFDFYHGSMGQASYQIAYDENDVIKEGRYYGTNVERQTNLGGITRDDLIKHAGEPVEEREIPDTGETNIIYAIGDYELQFVMAEDGTTDHVNLLKK